jgi:hypothetical protein
MTNDIQIVVDPGILREYEACGALEKFYYGKSQ